MKTKTILSFLAASFLLASCNAPVQKEIKLFNGKDLSGWGFVVADASVPASDVFSVKDGVIDVKGQPFGYMYTEEQYGDYLLHMEWRWSEGKSNSGLFLLVEDLASPFPKCIESQLEAGNAGDFISIGGAGLTPLTVAGSEADPTKKKYDSNENPVGEWNSADIAVKDGVITVYINGRWQNTGIAQAKKGHIALQSEGKGIQFRNLTVTKW